MSKPHPERFCDCFGCIQWLDGEYEDLDLEAWNELDLEEAQEPEGWGDDDGGDEE